MEPVLTPEIILQLSTGCGNDAIEHLDLSNGLLGKAKLFRLKTVTGTFLCR